MRVVFYARPWNVELLVEVEDEWLRRGLTVECRYITHQLQAARELDNARRDAVHLPRAVGRLPVEDPVGELARIEERFRGSLLPLPRYLMSERYFAGRDRGWQTDQLARYALFFERLLDDFQPDLLIGESPDIMPAWLAYDMARARGCEPVGMVPSTLPPGRLLMLRGHGEVGGARERFALLRENGLSASQRSAALELQGIVRGEGTKLDYLPPRRDYVDFARRLASGQVARFHLAGSLWQLRERAAGNWFVQPDPTLNRLKQPFQAVRAAVADRRHLVDRRSARQYVFYPLHFEPEATTLVHGSYFEDQLQVVRNLARSLPADWELVVKEHFYMRGQRRLGFYRALRSIPNLRLVPFEVPTNELIMGARVVAVISSTAGLEGALIGKPVLIFGHYPWDYAPTVRRVGPLAELPDQFAELAELELDPGHPDVLAFAASWDASLPPGRYFKTRAYDWREAENVRRIADALESRLPQHSGPPAAAREATPA